MQGAKTFVEIHEYDKFLTGYIKETGAITNQELMVDARALLAKRKEYECAIVEIVVGPGIDTFGGAGGESNARAFEVFGYPFMATKPE
jgi:hypothetical protein